MAVDMFLNIDSNKVKGESKDETHKDSIVVLSWSWGMSNSPPVAGAGGGKVSMQDISLTKYVDRSSPELMKACAAGTPYGKVKLIVRTSGGSPLEYIVLNFDNVFVSSVSTGGSGGEDRLTENVSLAFNKVKVQYQPVSEKGAKDGGLVEMGWDVSANKPV